jgi:hypothetical protein
VVEQSLKIRKLSEKIVGEKLSEKMRSIVLETFSGKMSAHFRNILWKNKHARSCLPVQC